MPISTPWDHQIQSKKHYQIDLDHITHHPEERAWTLKIEIAKAYKVQPEEVIVGNSIAELIDLYYKAVKPASILVAEPTFTPSNKPITPSIRHKSALLAPFRKNY